jgi:AcrR family transcriptional regulator
MPIRHQAATSARRGPDRSATGGGRRGPLSREIIVDAALAVARRDGVGGLSIRKLAAELRVTPMAVYHHLHSKEDILVGVIERVVDEAAATAHGVPCSRWQDWLRATCRAMYRALVEQPAVIPLLGSSLRIGPGALGVLDDMLTVLCTAGIDRATAMSGAHALISYTLGAAGLQATVRPAGSIQAPTARSGDPSDLADEIVRLARSDLFDRGLDLLLAGLATRRGGTGSGRERGRSAPRHRRPRRGSGR